MAAAIPTVLTDRFARAVDYARIAHAGQVRKGTDIPYFTHLLGVATLVIEHGGSEDQAIAGLLHDTIEDCGEAHEAIIRAQFGDTVARIVRACTDGTAEGKSEHTTPEAKRADWLRRKQAYLAHLAEASDEVLLVSGCDKLHNALAILSDLEGVAGLGVFDRFTGGQKGTLGYYESLHRVMSARGLPMARRLDDAVGRMHTLAQGAPRVPLPSTGPAVRFRVLVDDNFHYMDESERVLLGEFDRYEDALDAARERVDASLQRLYRSGLDEDALFSEYVAFGDDSFIMPTPSGEHFSAREYARARCAGICRPHKPSSTCDDIKDRDVGNA